MYIMLLCVISCHSYNLKNFSTIRAGSPDQKSSPRLHIELEEFENGAFTLKTHEMSSVHTTPEKFETEVSL